MMAGQPLVIAMLHQPGGAIAAHHFVSATLAQGQRCISAPVEEQHRLLAAAQRNCQGFAQRLRQPGSSFHLLIAQIDQADLRHLRHTVPFAQAQPVVTPALRVHIAFDRWRGAGQHDGTILQPRAHHRHVARMIDDAFFLLVGLLMLLVGDDKAQFQERQEQRRPRADHHARLAIHYRTVSALALLLRKIAVPFRGPAAEALGETIQELHGQRDFRQQDQRLLPALQSFRNRFEIGFGLARSRHAIEQMRGESADAHRLRHGIGGFLLLGIQDRLRKIRIGNPKTRKFRQFGCHQRTAIDQPAHHRRRHIRFRRIVAHAPRQPVPAQRQHARARIGHLLGRLAATHKSNARHFLLERGRHAQCQRQHLSGRRQRVTRHPIDEIAERFGQARIAAQL